MEKEQSIFNIAGKYGSYNIVDNEIVFEYPDLISISKEDLWKEIDADWVIWQSQEYARNRQPLYPAIGDQLDDLYHAGVFSAEMTATLKKVKDDNPK
jgi:hypothetical protein